MRAACALTLAAAAVTLAVAPSTLGSRGALRGAGSSRLLVYFAPPTGSSPLHGALELVDRRGQVQRVLSTARYGTWAKWSPDDSMIAWEDPIGIHVAAGDGSDQRLLVAQPGSTCNGCRQLSFVWSPDSRSLVVGSAGGPHGNELLRVPADGSPAAVLVGSTDSGHWYTPDWWTPGRRLVYTETTVAFTPTSMKVLTPATGKTETVWRSSTEQTPAPIISPNLRYRVDIRTTGEGHPQLRIVDRRTGAVHVVEGADTGAVSWAPDSSLLAVVEQGGRLVTVTVAGKVAHTIGPELDFSWGRAGELFIVRQGAGRQVWDSVDGQPERFLFHAPKGLWVVSIDGD